MRVTACDLCGDIVQTYAIHGKQVCELCTHKAQKDHITKVAQETIKEYYRAQYKAALLGLIVFAHMTPDELQDEVSSWLHYHVDSFNKPMKKVGE